MLAVGWSTLLRHIPESQHNQLVFVTRGGTEFWLQGILRVEHEFVVIKGRMGGSQDQGRVFFLPYDSIDYFGYVGLVKETEFQETFETLKMPAPHPVLTPFQPISDSIPQLVSSEPVPDSIAEAANISQSADLNGGHGTAEANTDRSSPPIKSEVLERFRANRHS